MPAAIAKLPVRQRQVVIMRCYESRSFNNCFGGRELTGRVLMTVAAGTVAFRQRSFALGVAS